ncbi:hypothetical protein DPM19_15885 [Actinomadura craniellae]|uniref:Uncharacterized protein n=1 Tax=Actinomadura craniellae TaxID=2231787 RepID=A0A365H613_9ACTN|nr:hypothetical protein [Actinomadura craniellae]RAY14436.1 hypothetical protein DPM19_15885 [Actinomadura craniellae]
MRTNRADRGEGGASYLAVILLIGAVTAAIATTGPGGTITSGLWQSLCRVTGDCVPPRVDNHPEPLPAPPHASGPPTRAVPRPSPGPPVPQPLPDPERIATERILRETPYGREALEWVQRNGVTVVYRRGGGSYYNPVTHTIIVDTSRSPEAQAATFIHETHHAKTRYTPLVWGMGRAEYISAAIDEEVEATLQGIRANQYLQRIRPTGEIYDMPYESNHDSAYTQAVYREEQARLKNEQPPLTKEEEARIGEEAARRELKRLYMDGTITGSTDGKPYPDSYGEEWDFAHGCFVLIFC